MSHIGGMLSQGALVDFDCSECVVTATLDSPELVKLAAAFPSARVMEQLGSFVPVTPPPRLVVRAKLPQ